MKCDKEKKANTVSASATAVELFGADGILAAFAAGVAFKLPMKDEADEQEKDAQESLDRLFEIAVFVLFGMMLPWQGWLEFGWRGVAFTAVVLLLRQLPVVVPASRLLSSLRRQADTLLTGWFGPVGIAAVFYVTLVVHETGSRQAWQISTLVIAAMFSSSLQSIKILNSSTLLSRSLTTAISFGRSNGGAKSVSPKS